MGIGGPRRLDRAERFARLTRRERVVLAALIDGLSAGEIAASSFVSPATVLTQIGSILEKLGVTSQYGAIAAARDAGWIFDGMGTVDWSAAAVVVV